LKKAKKKQRQQKRIGLGGQTQIAGDSSTEMAGASIAEWWHVEKKGERGGLIKVGRTDN